MATTIGAVFLVVFGTIIGAFGALLFKIGANKLKFHIKHIIQNYILISGIVLYVLSAVFFIIALKFGELTVLFPITAVSYIWILLLSKKFLNEDINIYKILGIIFIVAGISLIGIGA